MTVAIRVTPKAASQRIGEVVADARGRVAVKVAVTAAPEGGKANRAVIALLSRAWGVPKSAFSVQSGHTGRDKVLRIEGDTATLERKITETLRMPHHA